MNNYYIILGLLGSVLITAVVVYLFTDRIKAHKKYINTFAASVVAALIFVHILPDIYEVKSFWIGFAVMLGMIFQLVLEKITKGIEHGHVHSHSVNHKSILWGLLIGLGIHSVVEGMPILMSQDQLENTDIHYHGAHDHHHGNELHTEAPAKSLSGSTFVTAILFHKVPVTIVLSLFLLSVGVKRNRFFMLVTIFAIMTPLGGALGLLLSAVDGMQMYSAYFMSFSTGMLLHIITAILFEHSHTKKESDMHIIIITLGVTLGTLIFYL